MNKDELIWYLNDKLKLGAQLFLYKLELEEIQYLVIKFNKNGKNLFNSGFLMGALLF